MNGVVEGIFVTAEGSAVMERVDEVKTVEGCGVEGDRYCAGTGFWTIAMRIGRSEKKRRLKDPGLVRSLPSSITSPLSESMRHR